MTTGAQTGFLTARVLLLLLLISAGVVYVQADNRGPWERKADLETPQRMSEIAKAPVTIPNWPPSVGAEFPDVALYDHEGKPFSLRALKGKPVLLEVVAMSCAGCQAFSGANRLRKGFGGFPAQGGLDSIETFYATYTNGHELFSPEISFVQLIIYNLQLNPPTAKDLEQWRLHFNFDKHRQTYIVSGGAPLANKASFKMIPGFLLLDREQRVLFDATGHQPRHNLFTELLPGMERLLEGSL
jgi:hypothetical protein